MAAPVVLKERFQNIFQPQWDVRYWSDFKIHVIWCCNRKYVWTERILPHTEVCMLLDVTATKLNEHNYKKKC